MARAHWHAVTALGVFGLVALAVAPAATADPVSAGSASAFALELSWIDGGVVEPMPVATTPAPAPGEVNETAIDIPASPLALSGTLIARSAVHEVSDLPTELTQAEQGVAGPYNARGIGQIQGLRALIDEQIPGGELIEAAVLRAEAVAVCSGGSVTYAAQSEVIDLQIAGDDSLSGPLNELVDQITAGLNASPLAAVATVETNVVEVTATGASVDALVVRLFPEASEQDPRSASAEQAVQQEGEPTPFLEARFGHAEVANVSCAPPPDPTVLDNNPPLPRQEHPRTGGASPLGVAAVLGAGSVALYALRRRIA